ncbi:MAG: chemotaxis protein CheW [Bacillota bacterium]|nr:chemotaxis protein CheW [Bacillota bacterium]
MADFPVVIFRLGQAEYAVTLDQVQEIINVSEIARVPHAPPYVLGVLNLRGRILPVIDLKKRLNLGRTEIGESSRIVVAKVDDVVVGLLVDFVLETTSLRESDVESAVVGLGAARGREFIQGIVKYQERLLTLLDLGKVLERSSEQEKDAARQAG